MSTATRFRLIDELFQAAVKLRADEQAAFIDRHCGDDAALRSALLALLREDERAESALDKPIFDSSVLQGSIAAEAQVDAAALPETIGRYRIVREIGRGGMGIVYEAIQENPKRTVALKVISAGLGSRGLLRRFEQEASALGRLQHPGIAQIHEAGTFEINGRVQPFFAMEFVRGRPLLDYAAARDLDVRDRLELIARLGDAVEHAHQHGVIHRDLKPSNILVADDDSTVSERPGSRGRSMIGQPKILDFGVSRITESGVSATTLQTDVGQLVGTVEYMSPEQAAGDPSKIDTRSDVYSLGVLAYELIAGRLPYRLRDKLVHEAVRVIREEDPTPLSSTNRLFRGDVETIIAKALEKDPARRYQSAGELAADIRRYLADEPIVARPASTLYQFRKFARRNKAVVAGVAIAFAALTIGTAISITQAVVARAAAADAMRQAYRASLVAASSALRYHEISDAQRHLEAAPGELRGWEWDHLSSRLDDSVMALDVGFKPLWFAVSPDGRTIAAGSERGRVETWRIPELTLIASRKLTGNPNERRVNRLLFSSDGRELRADKKIGALRLDAQTLADIAGDGDSLSFLERSNDNRFGANVYVKQGMRRFIVVEIATGREVVDLSCGYGFDSIIEFSHDGEQVAISVRDQGLTIHRTSSGELLCNRTELDQCMDLAFSADGSRLAFATMTGDVGVIDSQTGSDLASMSGHAVSVTAIAFSPDEALIATASGDRTVRTWRAADGAPVSLMCGNQGAVVDLQFTPDGSMVVTIDDVGMIRWWDATRISDPFMIRTPGTVYGLAFSPAGDRIVAACLTGDQPLRIWDAATGAEVFAGSEGPLSALGISRDGALLAVGRSGSGESTIHARDGSELRTVPGHWWRTDWLAFRSNGRELLSKGNGGGLLVLDVESGTQVMRRGLNSRASGHGCGGAISPDESVLAVASKSTIHLLDGATLNDLGKLQIEAGHVYALAFSPDGTRLIAGSSDHKLHVWDLSTRKLVATLASHSHEIYTVIFSPDGSRFFSGGRDRVIRVWDAERLEEITQLHGHTSLVYCLAFSPDSRTLASGGGDDTVRLWDTKPFGERLRR